MVPELQSLTGTGKPQVRRRKGEGEIGIGMGQKQVGRELNGVGRLWEGVVLAAVMHTIHFDGLPGPFFSLDLG